MLKMKVKREYKLIAEAYQNHNDRYVNTYEAFNSKSILSKPRKRFNTAIKTGSWSEKNFLDIQPSINRLELTGYGEYEEREIANSEAKSESYSRTENSDEANSSETEASSLTNSDSKGSVYHEIPDNYDYSKELYISD
jgi:hypothetical protein